MKKTLHRIDERGVCEIPDYDYIKANASVDLNRCDSILLTGTRSGIEEPEEEIKRPQSGVLDIETSKKLDNPTYVDIPTESNEVENESN